MATFASEVPRRRHAVLLRLAVGAVFGIATWIGGLVWFAQQIPESVADATTVTDAIAVLTGAGGRLATGIELLADKRAKKLFVSGVYRGVDVATLLEISKRNPEDLACCIEIGHSADNTLGNAQETAAWIARQGYKSLRIVTSNYHMARSLLEFRQAMPDIRLIAHPVFHDSVKMERWWAWPGTAGLIFREYNKFLLAWLSHALGGFFSEGIGS